MNFVASRRGIGSFVRNSFRQDTAMGKGTWDFCLFLFLFIVPAAKKAGCGCGCGRFDVQGEREDPASITVVTP